MRFYSFSEARPYLRMLNRTMENEKGLCFDWCASGFECRFIGRAIHLYFERSTSEQPVYLRAFLDGVCHRFSVQPSGDYIILDGLPSGEHFLRFIRVTEPRDRLHFDRVILSRMDVVGAEDARLLPPPEAPDRRIAVFGDSITCGWGALAVENIGFRSAEEDVTASYSYKTVQAFGADYQIVSVSGQGLVRECTGEIGYPLPVFFDHLSPYEQQFYDHSCWEPQVLVLNIGTNDCGGKVTTQEMEQAGVAFLSHIRKLYPKAKIIWMYGMMGTVYSETIAGVIERLGDENIYYLEKPLPLPEEHCSFGHPSILGHDRGARALVDMIRDITGWIPEEEWR